MKISKLYKHIDDKYKPVFKTELRRLIAKYWTKIQLVSIEINDLGHPHTEFTDQMSKLKDELFKELDEWMMMNEKWKPETRTATDDFIQKQKITIGDKTDPEWYQKWVRGVEDSN